MITSHSPNKWAFFFCLIILAFSLLAAHFLTCFLSALPPRYVKHRRAGSLAPHTLRLGNQKNKSHQGNKVKKRVRLFLLPKPYLLPRPRWAGRPPVVVEVVGRGEAPRWHSLCIRGPGRAPGFSPWSSPIPPRLSPLNRCPPQLSHSPPISSSADFRTAELRW